MTTNNRREELDNLQNTLAEHRRQLTTMLLRTEHLEASVLLATERCLETVTRRSKKPHFSNNGVQHSRKPLIGSESAK